MWYAQCSVCSQQTLPVTSFTVVLFSPYLLEIISADLPRKPEEWPLKEEQFRVAFQDWNSLLTTSRTQSLRLALSAVLKFVLQPEIPADWLPTEEDPTKSEALQTPQTSSSGGSEPVNVLPADIADLPPQSDSQAEISEELVARTAHCLQPAPETLTWSPQLTQDQFDYGLLAGVEEQQGITSTPIEDVSPQEQASGSPPPFPRFATPVISPEYATPTPPTYQPPPPVSKMSIGTVVNSPSDFLVEKNESANNNNSSSKSDYNASTIPPEKAESQQSQDELLVQTQQSQTNEDLESTPVQPTLNNIIKGAHDEQETREQSVAEKATSKSSRNKKKKRSDSDADYDTKPAHKETAALQETKRHRSATKVDLSLVDDEVQIVATRQPAKTKAVVIDPSRFQYRIANDMQTLNACHELKEDLAVVFRKGLSLPIVW